LPDRQAYRESLPIERSAVVHIRNEAFAPATRNGQCLVEPRQFGGLPSLIGSQVDRDLNPERFDQEHGFAGRMGEIQAALDRDPWLLLSGHGLVVGVRDDLGHQIGALDKALARLEIGIKHYDVWLWPIVVAEFLKHHISKFDAGLVNGDARRVVFGESIIEQPFEVAGNSLMGDERRYHHDRDAFDQFPAFRVRARLLKSPELGARHATRCVGGSNRHRNLLTSRAPRYRV
jgi:hypothetical protein